MHDVASQTAEPSAPPPPILPAVAARVAGATRQCIDRYAGLVWSVAKRMGLSPADAEDLTQEVFLELWSKADAFDPDKGSEPAFIATIARRRLIDHLRKSGRRETPSAMTMPIADKPQPSPVEIDDEAAAAREAMTTLSDAQRTVLTLSVYEGFSYPEIADHLQMPLPTVKAHARRGMIAVRDAIDRRRQATEVRRRQFREERGLSADP